MELLTVFPDLPLLSGRPGPRPHTRTTLPFRQLDQFPSIDYPRRLFDACRDLPGVRCRQSRFAGPESHALCLADSEAHGPAEAFIDGREFCHLYPTPDGSIHLTLPQSAIEGVVALGWAVRHPVHKVGLHQNLVLVYAPRDAAELQTVVSLVEHSYRFAKGISGWTPRPTAAHAVV